MIRFVLIGDQIIEGENEFAFFDTVGDNFVSFDGDYVFSDIDDFNEIGRFCDKTLFERCYNLIPDEIKNKENNLNTNKVNEELSLIPRITSDDKGDLIFGSPESLKALGEALLLKAKLGRNFSCTFKDNINMPIRIKTASEIKEEFKWKLENLIT